MFVYPLVPVTITGSATEAKQDVIISELQDIETDIEAVNTTLTSTNTKLDTANSELQDIEADVENVATILTQRLSGSLAPAQYDEVVTTYVGATTKIDTVVYKLATVTVKTLTFTYDGSDRLTNVIAS